MLGAVELTKNCNPDKYSYSRYYIECDYGPLFTVQKFDWSKNVVIFGIETNLALHIDNKKKRYFNPWLMFITKIRWYKNDSGSRILH